MIVCSEGDGEVKEQGQTASRESGISSRRQLHRNLKERERAGSMIRPSSTGRAAVRRCSVAAATGSPFVFV